MQLNLDLRKMAEQIFRGFFPRCGSCNNRLSALRKIVTLTCGHRSCSECVLKIAVKAADENSVDQLICPVNPNCKVQLPLEVFKGLVEPELFSKIENSININNTKESSVETVPVCPLCQEGAEVDTDCFYGNCTKCSHVFCTKCLSDYHGFQCNLDEQLEPAADFRDLLEEEAIDDLLDALMLSIPPYENPDEAHKEAPPSCCMCLLTVDPADLVDFGCIHANSCKSCTKQFFETLIESGDIHRLKCPEPGCDKCASQAFVKEIVEPEVFLKYDDLLLNEALGNFPEIVNCPNLRCQRRVMAEPEYGYCENCDYRFCTECNQPFHGTTQCGMTDEELKKEILLEVNNEAKSQRKIQNDASEHLIKHIFKKCPKCNTNIEKIEGCNKMQCTKCQTIFCWLCGVQITSTDPYEHFRGTKCALFEVPPE